MQLLNLKDNTIVNSYAEPPYGAPPQQFGQQPPPPQ